jgi:hypothetical protein
VLDPGDLLVAAVKEVDAGHYTCIRANEAGEVHASAYLTVLGEGKAWNVQLISCCNVTITACAGMDFPDRGVYCSLILCKLVLVLQEDIFLYSIQYGLT